MRFLPVLICALIIGSPFSAVAQTKVSVRPNQTITLHNWSYFDENCDFEGLPHYRLSKPPTLGSVSVGSGTLKIRRVSEDNKKHCIGESIKSTIINYQAGSNPGVDKLSLARRRQSGSESITDFVITIQ